MRIDRFSEKCLKCGKGYFKELSIYDDWHGKVTCSYCSRRIERIVYHNFAGLSKEDVDCLLIDIIGGLRD